MLKPDRSGAKHVGVAGQETHDAFALTGGGVFVWHGRSRRLAGRADQAGIHPCIDIALGIANRPATILEEFGAAADATELFEVCWAEAGVGGALRRIESRIASVRKGG